MKLSISLLLLLSALAIPSQAETLTWKTGGGNLNDPNMWTDSLGADATFAPGDNGVINNGGTFEVDAGYAMDLGGGSLSFTTANGEGTLQGGGRITGDGTITIDIANPRFSLRTYNLLSDFEGDIVVNSNGTGIFRLGSNTNNNQDFGDGTIIMNGGFLRIEVADNETATILTTIRLTNGATISAHAKNMVNVTDLEIGDGMTDETVTWTGRGDGAETGSGTGNTILNVYGELSGSAGSTFILNGARPSGDYTATVKLHSENSYEGTLRVVGKDNTGGSVLRLMNAGAAQYATVDLQGGTAGAGVRTARANLSVDVNSATIGGLIGNANSMVTSTVASTLTVNNSEDNVFSGVIENGAGLALVKDGAGTLTLGNANTYAGGTTITEGILVAGNENALGTGNVTINGGELQLGGNLTLGGDLIMTSGTMDLSYLQTITSSGGTLSLSDAFGLTIDITGLGYSEGLILDLFEGFGTINFDSGTVTLVDGSSIYNGYFWADGSIRATAESPVIPEPTTAALFALAACGLVGRRNRRGVSVA